jgi:hypothetical protein
MVSITCRCRQNCDKIDAIFIYSNLLAKASGDMVTLFCSVIRKYRYRVSGLKRRVIFYTDINISGKYTAPISRANAVLV